MLTQSVGILSKAMIKRFKQSLTRKGNCCGNAVVESFLKNLKTEWVYNNHYHVYSDA